jgi:hypothetical protein
LKSNTNWLTVLLIQKEEKHADGAKKIIWRLFVR